MSEVAAAGGAPQRWQVPAIDGSSTGYPTASRLEELQKAAFDEAWQQGYEEGLQAGQAELAARAERLDELLVAQNAPFDALDEQIEKQLVELSMTVARQLFRRELKSDPGHVVGVVRDALHLLPVASRGVQVHLHPEDAALVRESLSATDGERAWRLLEDPLIARGGCRVTSEYSQIDAQNETRLNALIAAIAGDDRHA